MQKTSKPRYFLMSLAFVGLVGCAKLPQQSSSCVGDVITPPVGLQLSAEQPPAGTIGAPKAGALCTGKVFVAMQPVRVYRVWDAAKPYTQYGKWWSFDAPKGPRDTYRLNNAICPEWSPLNQVSSCTLKVGTQVVVGPGQSAECADKTLLPAAATNQVYVPNDSLHNVVAVENCSAATAWP